MYKLKIGLINISENSGKQSIRHSNGFMDAIAFLDGHCFASRLNISLFKALEEARGRVFSTK